MAVPNLGKYVVLLVLLLIVYTSHAFRIRDALPSTGNIEASRSNACGETGFGKCTGDASRTDSSSILPARTTRRRYETLVSKARQPPDVDEASEELEGDDGGHGGKMTSSVKVDKWKASEARKMKFGRIVVNVDENEEESEQITGDNDDNSASNGVDDDDGDEDVEEIDADADDDGVEISNGDGSEEDSEEIIDADEEEEDDDDDDDEDGAGSEEVSQENDEEKDIEDFNRSEEETNSDDDEDDKDDDDDEDATNTKTLIKQVTDSSRNLGSFKSPSKKREKDDPDDFMKKDISRKESIERISTKTTNERITVEKVDSDDEEMRKKKGLSKQRKVGEVVKDIKESNTEKKVYNQLTKKYETESDEDDNDRGEDDDEDDEDDDDDEGDKDKIVPESTPLRKLEKVRLADKEKSKSVQVVKPVTNISEKAVESTEPIAKNTDEGKKKQKKDTEKVNKVTKSETGKPKSTSPLKLETKVKLDISSKTVTNASSEVKSETSKSMITKDTAKSKVQKIETVAAETRDDTVVKGMVNQSEKSKLSPEVKKSGKKVNESGGTDKKDRSKTRKQTDAAISLTKLNDAILQVPTFVPNFTAIEDPVCQQHGKIFLRQLRGYKLWALQMLDASAKIPSGLLRGNVNQLGDFDQCLGITARVKVDEKTVKVQGKYCLASLDLHASLPDMKVPVNFMQSRGFIRASMRDPGHFVPRFTTVNWAICIPAACSAEDARSAIESGLSQVNVSSGLRFTIDVDPDMCYVRQKSQTYSKETIGVLYFYAMIICVVLVATVRDHIVGPQEKGNYSERIIMSFSLRRTWKILTKEENTSSGEISCIHGIRSLATIALYVAHKMIPASQIPYANRISLTEIANNPISSLLRTSLAYTDCFLLLSGLLTAFHMARESNKRGEIRWFCRFVARFIRLTAALLVMVFWYAYVMEHTGSGPQWNRIIATNAELCKQNSWTNLLYIQNFFPFEEMCATHTHQLALDMQLSLIAPILVFFLTFKPVIGILVVFFILLFSATLRYFATTNNYLSLVIFHGMTMKHLYKTANLTYALPLHRATPYVFGVGLGVLLHYTGKNIRIYRIFVIFGWLIATILGFWCLFSPWRMARRDYTYDVEEAAHYAVIAPVTWSLTLCWIIFACFTDHGGIVNKFLSSYWMMLFSRISYAVYLCQFAIFFYNVGTTRYSSEFQIHRLIDPYEAIVVTLVSVVLTLLIDIPMQEVKNVIMESTDGRKKPIVEENIDSQEVTGSKEIVPSIEELHSTKEEEFDQLHWHDDAVDGLTRLEDSGGEEFTEKWRPRTKSDAQRQSYVRRETYEDEEDEEMDEEEEEEEEEEGEVDRPTEWSWVKRTGSRISVEDDGLVEQGRTSQSDQWSSYIEPEAENRQSLTYQYQRDDDQRRERRSHSRQADPSFGLEESPRGSLKRERSTSRVLDPRISESEHLSSTKQFSKLESRGGLIERPTTPSWQTGRRERSPKRERSLSRVPESKIHSEIENVPSSRQRSQSRSSFSSRDVERTVTPSWESPRHERSPKRERSSSRVTESKIHPEMEDIPSNRQRSESRGSFSSRDVEKTTSPSYESSRHESKIHPEMEDIPSNRQRSESRSSFSGRDFERTVTPSWESSRHERSPKGERSSSRVAESKIHPEMEDIPSSRQRSESRSSFSSRDVEKTTSPSYESSRHESKIHPEMEDTASNKQRSESRGTFSGRDFEKTTSPSYKSSRQERSPSRAPMTPRREPARLLSSGSEDEDEPFQPQQPQEQQEKQQQQQRAPKIVGKSSNEPKVSDEEDWEQELRIRRRKFMERLASEDRDTKLSTDESNDVWDSVKRRSSAEGKLALLKDPTGSNVMDSWTISKGPRVSLLGSSQETEDDNSYGQSYKDYREIHHESSLKEDERSEEESNVEQSRRHSYTSGSQVTSLEEEEDVANNDFVLKKDSKRITVMDLSKLSQLEEPRESIDERVMREEEINEEQPKMAALKLFKRESIVKSQASEEDPEYLLPERPKLMEQEQDHPFKKAWQLQKSRSEEDGPSAYTLKDVKTDSTRGRAKASNNNNKDNDHSKESASTKSTSGPQSTLENYHDDEDTMDTNEMWVDRSSEDCRSSTRSTNETDSSRLEWPSEDEQFDHYELRNRRQSEQVNYEWELEET